MIDHGDAHGHRVHGRLGGDDRSRRLEAVLRACGIRPVCPPANIESHSNDTYLLDDQRFGAAVLRICYRGDIERLLREATIGRALPPDAGYPEVLGSGEAIVDSARVTWSITRRLRGSTLIEAWPGLSDAGRRDAARSVAHALRALHRWRLPAPLVSALSWPATGTLETPTAVIGASMHPLPIVRSRLLLDALSRVDGVEPTLVRAASRTIERLRELEPAVDDPTIGGLIHGDVHLDNIWWSDHGVASLIDLEWARFAPAWVDLARIRDSADADAIAGLDSHVALLAWLRIDYPELFAVDRLDDRLRLLCLVFGIRQALIWPAPDRGEVAPDHPLRMIGALV